MISDFYHTIIMAKIGNNNDKIIIFREKKKLSVLFVSFLANELKSKYKVRKV